MAKSAKVASTEDEWDLRKLGGDDEHVRRADKSHEEDLDRALGLQMISVRLQKQLIDDLKFIATAHGIGYQPLMRDILTRFVTTEKKKIIRDALERRALEELQRNQAAIEAATEAQSKPAKRSRRAA